MRKKSNPPYPQLRNVNLNLAELRPDQISSLISEESLELALEGAGDGVWDWNIQTDEAIFSKRYKEMLGYAEHEFPCNGNAWVEHLHPDDKERVLSAVGEHISGRQPLYAVEFRMYRKDGSWEWILARGKLISRDDNGNPLRMIGTHISISGRKRMEQQLMENQMRYQQMFDDAASIAFLTDPESGDIVDANTAASVLWGYTREELRGMHISKIISASREDIHAVLLRFRDKLAHRHEWLHRLKNGELREVEMYSGPLVVQRKTLLYSVLHDITERKRAEAALHESEAHLRLLEEREIVQTSLDGFFVSNSINGQILEVNDAFCRMVGYTREELLSRRIFDLEANESPADTAAHINKVMTMGYDRFETRHRHKRGQLINFEISASHSELDGDILFVFARDITERLRAEKELRESENRFRTLFESAVDCMLMLDTDGRIVDINRNGYERLGYEKQEMLGRRIAEFDLPEFAAAVPQRLTEIEQNGNATFESAHVRKDGTVMPVEISCSVIHLNGEPHYFSVIRDITKRKRAEQKVAELQYRDELILNTAGDGICGIDINGRIYFANPAAVKMLGYNLEALHGLSIEKIADSHACQHADCAIPIHLHNITTCRRDEEIYRRKDGSTFQASCSRAPIIEQGKCIGSVLMFRDITERKQAEKQLRELTAHLQTVREEEKSHFAREIHDDLGSTLASLKIEISMLNSEIPAELKKSPQFSRVESIADLLDEAMAATRRIITDLRPPMLDEQSLLPAMNMLATQFHQRTGIECRCFCIYSEANDCGACNVCKDKLDKPKSISLFRIFQESLHNVAQHSGASQVEVEFRPTDSEIILSLSDDGHGLPEGHIIPQNSYGIRGMRERAEQLGGTIEFDSPQSGGLRVQVKIPLLIPSSPAKTVNHITCGSQRNNSAR